MPEEQTRPRLGSSNQKCSKVNDEATEEEKPADDPIIADLEANATEESIAQHVGEAMQEPGEGGDPSTDGSAANLTDAASFTSEHATSLSLTRLRPQPSSASSHK